MIIKISNSLQRAVKPRKTEEQCHGSQTLRGEHRGLLSEPRRPCHSKGSGKIDCDAIRSDDIDSWQAPVTSHFRIVSQGGEQRKGNIKFRIVSSHLNNTHSWARLGANSIAFFAAKSGDRHVYLRNCSIFPVGRVSPSGGEPTDFTNCSPAVLRSFLFSLRQNGDIKETRLFYTSVE